MKISVQITVRPFSETDPDTVRLLEEKGNGPAGKDPDPQGADHLFVEWLRPFFLMLGCGDHHTFHPGCRTHGAEHTAQVGSPVSVHDHGIASLCGAVFQKCFRDPHFVAAE